jgi:hypothetical protein
MRISPRQFGVSIVLAACIGWADLAGAAEWKFDLYNKSARTVTSFATFDEGEWGDNWLGENITPDDAFDMEYSSETGTCKMPTRIEFESGPPYESEIDYCALKTLTVRDNDVTVE